MVAPATRSISFEGSTLRGDSRSVSCRLRTFNVSPGTIRVPVTIQKGHFTPNRHAGGRCTLRAEYSQAVTLLEYGATARAHGFIRAELFRMPLAGTHPQQQRTARLEFTTVAPAEAPPERRVLRNQAAVRPP